MPKLTERIYRFYLPSSFFWKMWKKSGAWFFKGLPKYVLPEKKQDLGSKNLPPSAHKVAPAQTNNGARNRQGRNFHNWALDAPQTQGSLIKRLV